MIPFPPFFPTTGFLISAAIGAVMGVAGCFSVWTLYDNLIDDPRVRAEVRDTMVAKVEHDAALAELAEQTRQRLAAQSAFEQYRLRLAIMQSENTQISVKLEQEIQANEDRLLAAGRSCLLDGADVNWLRQ